MAEVLERPEAAVQRISPQALRHNEMRREAVRLCPELRKLAGTDPRTALAVPALLAAHWGAAWLVSGGGLPTVFLAAFLFGQVTIHAAGALVHETAHRLIFRGAKAKLAFDMALEFVLASYGKQLTYQHEHITSHHPYIGDYERDYEHEDICAFQARHRLKTDNPRLQRMVTVLTLILHLLPLGFILGEALLPRLNARLGGAPVRDPSRRISASRAPKWQVRLFVAISIASNLLLLALFGPWALLYHVWSLSIFLGKCGVSNLGQSLSEHAGSDTENPTRSTYGRINWLLFNTGFHNEHHTFPNVPWTRLPALRSGAPEVFAHEAERSYLGYWWDHVRQDFTATRHNSYQDQDNSARCRGDVPAV